MAYGPRAARCFSHLADDTVQALEGRTIASFGDAATLGMWAFATGALATGLFEASILPMAQMQLLFPVLLSYSGVVLFIAGLFLFRRNNTFLASAFCSFGAFNFTRGVLLACEAHGLLPAGSAATILQGVLVEVFAYIALSLLLGAVRINVVMCLVLICTFAGYGLSGLPFVTDHLGQQPWSLVGKIGGWALLGSSAFAYYGGTALLVNTAWRDVVLPIGGQA